MTAPTLPALALTFVIVVAASLAAAPAPQHSSHHPQEMSGTERALGRVAAALAQRMAYPR